MVIWAIVGVAVWLVVAGFFAGVHCERSATGPIESLKLGLHWPLVPFILLGVWSARRFSKQ